MSELIERAYEAAFLPELWPQVLGEIAQDCGAHSGALLLIDRGLPPLFAATPNVVETLGEFARTDFWYANPPAHRLRKLQYPGFLERAGFFTDDERNSDNPYHHNMIKIGADWQVGSVVDLPNGEMALFTFERRRGLPDFDGGDLARLDSVRPHLARASLMAWRLKLERAQASVLAMEAIGVPAAVVSFSGTVLSVNALFDGLTEVLRPAAFGRLAARDRSADQLLQEALPGQREAPLSEVRSIPMALPESKQTLVVHVIPLHRSASDIFDRGAAMVTVTGYALSANVPADTLLRGLFDLSVAEARVAAGLAAGLTLAQIARERGVGIATVRTHLSQIFLKTGTSQQGQLIALLKGTSGVSAATH